MQYHLIMTQSCNLHCTYCGQEPNTAVMPTGFSYSVEQLKNFVEKHEEPPVLAFYGGEPLLSLSKVKQIMDELPEVTFVIQTNGTLLHKLPPQYTSRFHTILISVDGRKELNDLHRGEGTYERSLSGARYCRENGFNGELIARMTVTTDSDIYEEVTHLAELGDPKFDIIHWQLDAMWDIVDDDYIDEYAEWLSSSYIPGVRRLVNYWISGLRRGEVVGIAPFMGITHSLLSGERSGLRCGAGIDFFAVTTDGRITACPIPPSLVFPVLGDIQHSTPAQLPNKLPLLNPCTNCDYRDICGGRCLYTNRTKHWGMKGFNLICGATKATIDALREALPEIRQLMDSGTITLEQFRYPKLPNGVEVIP